MSEVFNDALKGYVHGGTDLHEDVPSYVAANGRAQLPDHLGHGPSLYVLVCGPRLVASERPLCHRFTCACGALRTWCKTGPVKRRRKNVLHWGSQVYIVPEREAGMPFWHVQRFFFTRRGAAPARKLFAAVYLYHVVRCTAFVVLLVSPRVAYV